jgi:hypothetical protein
MFLRWTVIAAAGGMALWAGSCPPASVAQPVFFDDFDGDKLLPHWRTPADPSSWEYDVSGGMLNVTDLHFPSVPHLGGNFAIISALFEPQMNFRMDVWMGWDDPPRQTDQLRIGITGPLGGGIMAEFGLMDLGAPPAIVAAAGAAGVIAPPPPPGLHQFTIARTGSLFDFYLDGDHFASLPDTGAITPAGGLFIWFAKPFPAEMNPYHVDRVRVVPAPGTLFVSSLCLLACARRRR